MLKLNKLKTILFDMDGVVIDSEKLHLRAMEKTLKMHGIKYTESFINGYVGRSDVSFFQYVYDNMDSSTAIEDLINEKNAHFENLLNEIQFVDGFTDFVQHLKSMKLQTGLVTSSSLYTVKEVDKLLNIIHFFDIVITEEDTQNHKPNPEPYLLALKLLGAEDNTTLIIEDSTYGIKAGKAAGCKVAGLTTSFDAKTLHEAGADYVAESFAALKIENN